MEVGLLVLEYGGRVRGMGSYPRGSSWSLNVTNRAWAGADPPHWYCCWRHLFFSSVAQPGQALPVVKHWLKRLQAAYDACCPTPAEVPEFFPQEPSDPDPTTQEPAYQPSGTTRAFFPSDSTAGSTSPRAGAMRSPPQLQSPPMSPPRSPGFGGEGEGTPRSPRTREYYAKRVRQFYETYNPEKLADLERILDMYKGQEEEMLQRLYQKYNVQAPAN